VRAACVRAQAMRAAYIQNLMLRDFSGVLLQGARIFFGKPLSHAVSLTRRKGGET